MKRGWAALLTAIVVLGCRSSQPTTNPFLRTTVPPPATGQGAVVMPGEPYYPGGAPPAAVAPAVDPAAAPVVPVVPPAGAAPPPAPLRNNKYSPPGGSFIYNQSSIERPRRARPDAGDEQALASSKTARDDVPQTLARLRLPPAEQAVEQVARMSHDPDPVEMMRVDGDEAPPTIASVVAQRMPKVITPPAEALQNRPELAQDQAERTDASDDVTLAAAASSDRESGTTTVLRITAGPPAGAEAAGSSLAVKRPDPSGAQAENPDGVAADWSSTPPRGQRRRTSTGTSAWRASVAKSEREARPSQGEVSPL